MPDFARVTKPWRTGADGKERGRTDRWCPGAELNHRHRDFQSRALPTELPGQTQQDHLLRWKLRSCRKSSCPHRVRKSNEEFWGTRAGGRGYSMIWEAS